MDTRFTRKNHKKPNKFKKPDIKSFSAGHHLIDDPPNEIGVWTEDMSNQIRKEKTFLQREQERKRRAAIEAMKLDEQRKLMRAKENAENEGEVVSSEKKNSLSQGTSRRALFTLNSNQMNQKPPLASPPALPVIKETEDNEKENVVPKRRPILGARHKPGTSVNTNLSVGTINRMKDLKISRTVSPNSLIRYDPDELLRLNPFLKNGKFCQFYR